VFQDPDVVKLNFDGSREVENLYSKRLFRRGGITNVISLQNELNRMKFWPQPVFLRKTKYDTYEIVPHLRDEAMSYGEHSCLNIEGNLEKFIFLCTAHDGYKIAVRHRQLQYDLDNRRDFPPKFMDFMAEEYTNFLLDYSYFNQSCFLIFFHDYIMDLCPYLTNNLDFLKTAAFFLRN